MRFACNAYVEACTAQLPALAFVRTVQFFRPINNERKFIFPSAVFAMCDAAAAAAEGCRHYRTWFIHVSR